MIVRPMQSEKAGNPTASDDAAVMNMADRAIGANDAELMRETIAAAQER